MKRVLRFRAVDRNIFDFIRRKKKTVETRAGTKKYRDIKKGDILVFVCGGSKFQRKIKKVLWAKSPSGLLREYKISNIRPDIKTKKEFIESYNSFPGYTEKIKRFGIMAFEV